MDTFLTAKETIAKLNIKDFQLFDLMKQGLLQAYTEYGKKVINSDELERKPRDTLETILANQKAKRNATTGPRHSCITDEELLGTAKRLYRLQSLVIVNQPPDTEAISFIELSNKEKPEQLILGLLLKAADVEAFIKGTDNTRPTEQVTPKKIMSDSDKKMLKFDKQLLKYVKTQRRMYPRFSIPDIAHRAIKDKEEFLELLKKFPKKETLEKHIRKLLKDK